MRRTLTLLLLSTLCAVAFAQTNTYQTPVLLPKPTKVIGDPDFIGTVAGPAQYTSAGPNVVQGRELNQPLAVGVDTSTNPPNIYIADTGNNRVLGFRYTTQLQAGSVADIVIGQIDRFSNLPLGPGTTRSTGLNAPSGLAVDSRGNLYVADTGNNRILRFPTPFNQPAGVQFPDLVIGQTTTNTSTANAGGLSPTSLSLSVKAGMTFDASGNLWVCDSGNNRVLRYPAANLAANKNGPAADVALGQPDLQTERAVSGITTKSGLARPTGVAVDSTGRIYVADSGRVLSFPAGALTGTPATRIVGIDTSLTTSSSGPTQISLTNPFGVAVSAAGLVVADTGDNRIMIFPLQDNWQPEAYQFSPSATSVIGQSSFTSSMANQGNGDSGNNTLASPTDVTFSNGEMFVADAANSRVIVYNVSATGITVTGSRVIGQLDFPYNTPNLIEGDEFGLVSSQSSISGTALLDYSSTPPHLYVADTQNNRILGFANFSTLKNLQKADIVIGQPDLFRSITNYPSNMSTQPNAQGLNSPSGMVVDAAGNLYVADTGNSRILRFPTPFGAGKPNNLQTADLVIGQSNFTARVTDATAATLSAPIGITLTSDAAASNATSGYLIVADAAQNRVLFYPVPFSNGISATKVLGQLNFNDTPGSGDPQRFRAPRGVTVDPQNRVIVTDTGNHRIQIFDVAKNIQNYATPPISLVVSSTSGSSAPYASSSNSGGIWVADAGTNSLVHYPPVDQLPIRNYASDAAISAVSPRSVFVDAYSNVLIGDGINRVLYYAPAVTVNNAANYSTKPVAAQTIVALFPANPVSSIAAGTAYFGDLQNPLPVPTVLSDTQVTINGTASPLFFVSPGQINLPLSNSLATGGTADLQISRISTGQIYGAAELALASASPALFTVNQIGSGQVAAVNVADGTVNSAANPVTRGQYVSLYGTGVGPIPNAPPDGTAATTPLPSPSTVQVLFGTSSSTQTPVYSSNVQFSGISGLIGVWQINVQVPTNAPSGISVPIRVFQNSIPSLDPGSTQVTTLSIK